MKKSNIDTYTLNLFPETPVNIVTNNASQRNRLMEFGKYKGQPVEVLANDPNYCQYLINQHGFKEQNYSLYQIIINNFFEPNDTPEHNALQARFTDNNFCFALGKLCNWILMHKSSCIRNIERAINKLERANYNSYSNNQQKIDELIIHRNGMKENVYIKNGIEYNGFNDPLFIIGKVFEQDGWDLIIQTDDANTNSSYCRGDFLAYNDCDIKMNKIAVEIKPTLGDNYPAILRQMKMAKTHPDFQCLVYESFNATNVTLDQIKEIFSSFDFKIFSFIEIENAKKELLSLTNPLLSDTVGE